MSKKNMLICLNKTTWGGQVCYGNAFRVKRTETNFVAICEKCGKEHVIKEKSNG